MVTEKPYKGHKNLYKNVIAVRVPDAVYDAIMKRVETAQVSPLFRRRGHA